ncbi:glycosyltransferase family 2 protein [Robertmurraya sp. GLU-23]
MVKERVAAIMVTYNPEKDLIENVKSIAGSASSLIIIDNGSGGISIEYLKEVENIPFVTVIYNGINKGLGTALNQGIQLILENVQFKEIEWIATFDQDSKISEDFFRRLLQVYDTLSEKEKVAILAPNWVDENLLHEEMSEINQVADVSEPKTVITSGSLIKKSVFREIGLFIEEYFIDFLDIEFCLRARDKGYKIIMAQSVSMLHNLGNTKRHNLLGSKVMATNHNYIRRYYITRNRIHTYKKYFKSEKEWLREDLTATFKETIIVLLFEKDRFRKIGSMIKGSIHGIIGKTGPM